MQRHVRVFDGAKTSLRHFSQPADLRVFRLQQTVLAEVQLPRAHRALPRRRRQELPLPVLRQGLHHQARPRRSHAAATQEPAPHLPALSTRFPAKVEPEAARPEGPRGGQQNRRRQQLPRDSLQMWGLWQMLQVSVRPDYSL